MQYRLTDQEIKGLQFYLSSEVLAQTVSATETDTPTGNNVILVKKGTPGMVTGIGPDWLRVGFTEKGPGMPFLANIGSGTDVYELYNVATTVEGSTGFKMVKEVPDHIVSHEGVRYRLVEGFDAILTCDGDQLQELIDKRSLGPGRQ